MSKISDVAIPLDVVQPAEYDFEQKKKETMIAFTDEQIDFILAYQKESGADTVQDAILNAISLAFDDQDKVSEE